MRRATVVLLSFVLSLSAILIAAPSQTSARSCQPCPGVTTTDLNLRAGPSTSAAVITVMPEGVTVELPGETQNGFFRTNWNGHQGWAFADFIDTGIGGVLVTATTDLNLRAGPSVNDQVLLVIPSGASVTRFTEVSNGYRSVAYAGVEGWAYDSYLSTQTSPATAVVTTSLNLRAGPSASDKVLAVMNEGDVVILTGSGANGFVSVVYNGQSGYAYGDYLN